VINKLEHWAEAWNIWLSSFTIWPGQFQQLTGLSPVSFFTVMFQIQEHRTGTTAASIND